MPLFGKIEEGTAQQLKERFAGKQQPQGTPAAAATTAGLQELLDKQVNERPGRVNSDLRALGGGGDYIIW